MSINLKKAVLIISDRGWSCRIMRALRIMCVNGRVIKRKVDKSRMKDEVEGISLKTGCPLFVCLQGKKDGNSVMCIGRTVNGRVADYMTFDIDMMESSGNSPQSPVLYSKHFIAFKSISSDERSLFIDVFAVRSREISLCSVEYVLSIEHNENNRYIAEYLQVDHNGKTRDIGIKIEMSLVDEWHGDADSRAERKTRGHVNGKHKGTAAEDGLLVKVGRVYNGKQDIHDVKLKRGGAFKQRSFRSKPVIN